MSIYRVIDKLETYVREGTWMPFGLRALSEERLVEFIEKMRSTLPEEVGRAKVIATNKDRVIREAQEKAQLIVDEATTAHSQMIDQSEIVRQARLTAEVVLREAEERARKVRAGADAYAAQVLAELEGRLSTALGSVRKGQEALHQQRGATAAAAAPLAEAAAKTKRAAFDAQTDPPEAMPVEAKPVEVTS
jgi:hypothetical protein